MKKKLTNNLTFKILSVVFAVILWLLVMNLEDPDKTVTVRGIPVSIINENAITGNAQVYEVKSGNTCDVTVTGPRSIVDSLSADDFVATADFFEISQTNAIPINITLSENNQKYQNKLNITQKKYTMKISIEKIISKEYEIELQQNGKMMSGYLIGKPVLSANTVKITASESIISSIEDVRAVIDISQLSSDLDKEVQLTLYNASGKQLQYAKEDIKLSVSEINVKAPVYNVKEIPVKYEFPEGAYGNTIVNGTSIDKPAIKIYGRKDKIDAITELVIPAELLDMENLSEDNTFIINVEDILPEGVYVYSDFENVIITVEMSNIETKTFTISLADVMIKKIPEGFGASIVDSGEITVRLRGAEDILSEITVENLLPYVDLTGAAEGENTVSIILTLPEGITQQGVVDIKVNLNNKSEENTEVPSTEVVE